MRCLLGAPALDPAEHGEQLGRPDLRDRPLADPGEEVLFQAPQDAVAVTRHPARRELGVPLARDGLETFRPSHRELLGFAGISGIDPCGDLLAGSITLGAGGFQAHGWIDAKGQTLFPAGEAILPAPPLATSGADFEVEASPVEHLDGLGLRLGGSESFVGQRHVGATAFCGFPVAPKVAPILGAAVMGRCWIMPDTIYKKPTVTNGFSDFMGFCRKP